MRKPFKNITGINKFELPSAESSDSDPLCQVFPDHVQQKRGHLASKKNVQITADH